MRIRSSIRQRRQHVLRIQREGGKLPFRSLFVAAISVFTCLVLSTHSALAIGSTYRCQDNTGDHYSDYHAGGYWYAQMETGTSSGYPPNNTVNLNYNTLGAKANLTTGGNPVVTYPSTQHVLVQITAEENSLSARWVQVGWDLGFFGTCTGQTTTNGIEVFVEIIDDTSSPCLEQLYGTAPSNASYDARYYGVVNGKYEYHVYYQAPGSSTIQYLAYGDFNNQHTAEIAGGEVLGSMDDTTTPPCPTLSQSGQWNLVGNPQSNTFASTVQLWNGSGWYDWTPTSVNPTSYFNDAPYTFQSLSQFIQDEVGGQ